LLSESKFCFPKASFAFPKQVLLSQSKFCFGKAKLLANPAGSATVIYIFDECEQTEFAERDS
jgi:hypothetical protein